LTTFAYNESTDKLRKTFSNKLAFETIIQNFISSESYGPNEWIFLFEDDIRVNPNVVDPYCYIRAAMLLASPPMRKIKKNSGSAPHHVSPQHVGDGIVYLGLCLIEGTICESPVENRHSHFNITVEMKRCFGHCAHAFGVVKWKAPSLLSELQSLHNEFSDYSDFHFFDVGLLLYGKVHPILLLGSNLQSPQCPSHMGLFYQDRMTFPTTIG